jgi:hypothetical protein
MIHRMEYSMLPGVSFTIISLLLVVEMAPFNCGIPHCPYTKLNTGLSCKEMEGSWKRSIQCFMELDHEANLSICFVGFTNQIGFIH